MGNGSAFPIMGAPPGTPPRIGSLLIKPVSAVCNLDCAYCFYLDRAADPYQALPGRRMSLETLERLVESYLLYSYPQSVFAFQGGEPTLAGLAFFEKLVEFQVRHGRAGQGVSNALQTNGMLIDDRWCRLFRQYNWLIGISIDGPPEMHDVYRVNKQGRGTGKKVIQGIETLQRNGVDFNALCVLSQANVSSPKEVYRFLRSLGIEHIQYLPLSEFDANGDPLPFTIMPEQYGRFMAETFELWWPDRGTVRIRNFDNIAEALAGQKPGDCTLHESCDSYVVVEYNGDVYPCDFFVEDAWKLGNLHVDSWQEIAGRQQRFDFAAKKTLGHPECQRCEWRALCHGGCPKHRHDRRHQFEDLDYFCSAYKTMFATCVPPLKSEVDRILGRV